MKKIFDRKDVISWSNSEDAKKYVEQPGYFGNSFQELITNVNNDSTSILWNVFRTDEVHCVFEDANGIRSGLFLSMDKVKEVKEVKEEKKWKPFTLEGFNKVIPMGTVFKYRYKGQKHIKSIYYHANLYCENGYQAVFFEDCVFDFDYCFGQMELFLNGKWQPFGVENKNS